MTLPRLTARLRLTLLYAALIALSGSAVAALVIALSFVPATQAPLDKMTEIDKQVTNRPVKVVESGAALVEEAATAKAAIRAELRNRMVGGAAVVVGALTLLSGGLGWWVAGRVLRPVHTVSGTARRLSEQNLHERIPVSGPNDEMRELAETFNGMLARLQRSFEAQSRFAANASHELRGPMTTQRALVEVAAGSPDTSVDLRELVASLRPVLGRQERVVDGLLELAWSEHGMSSTEPVRLDLLVRTALDRRPLADLAVSADLRPSQVLGDPVLLDLLVDNVIRNAERHNVVRGRVWVTTGERALTVENTGVPISAERLAELVEPFRRGSRDRVGEGAGLGLAIVTAVAHAHHAEVTLTPRPGGGIRLRVDFPATTHSPSSA
ncbi:MAG: HAMP domain-containing histidine kinase [Pseudonocardiaceae bacterium]|nr:HAMP domain-containing histidine kinase [Pseudonocardiaceae bacterium]